MKRVSPSRVGKLGRVFDLNCCSSELHKQPGERDNPVPAKLDQAYNRGGWEGPLSSRTRAEQRSRHAQQTISPGGVCTQGARRINQDAHHRFKIPLWNLRREQQISRYVSAWYPYSQYPQTAGRSPGPPRISPIPWAGPLALPTVSSHGEFTAA